MDFIAERWDPGDDVLLTGFPDKETAEADALEVTGGTRFYGVRQARPADYHRGLDRTEYPGREGNAHSPR